MLSQRCSTSLPSSDSLSFSRSPPFNRSKDSLSVVKAFSSTGNRCRPTRGQEWRGMLVRCSIRDKSIRIVFRLKRFPLYLRCVRFFKIKIQEITTLRFFFAIKINIYYDRSTLITLCFIDNSNKLILRISEIEKNKLQELQTHKIFDINEEKPYLTFRIIEETYTKNSIETYYSLRKNRRKKKKNRREM